MLYSIIYQNEFQVNQKNEEENKILRYIFENGDPQIIKYIVNCGIDLNIDGSKPLIYTIHQYDIEKVKLFISNRARINLKDDIDCLPLYTSISYGKEDIVRYLIDHGAEVNMENIYGNTPLIHSNEKENLSILKYLVHAGALVNKEKRYYVNPVNSCSFKKVIYIIKYLVHVGADINQRVLRHP